MRRLAGKKIEQIQNMLDEQGNDRKNTTHKRIESVRKGKKKRKLAILRNRSHIRIFEWPTTITPWEVTMLLEPLSIGMPPESGPVGYPFPLPPAYPRFAPIMPVTPADAVCDWGGPPVPVAIAMALGLGCAPSLTEKFRQNK